MFRMYFVDPHDKALCRNRILTGYFRLHGIPSSSRCVAGAQDVKARPVSAAPAQVYAAMIRKKDDWIHKPNLHAVLTQICVCVPISIKHQTCRKMTITSITSVCSNKRYVDITALTAIEILYK